MTDSLNQKLRTQEIHTYKKKIEGRRSYMEGRTEIDEKVMDVGLQGLIFVQNMPNISRHIGRAGPTGRNHI